jgi:RNA 2',3'-cyclic 3'-phosphodiesterase
MRQAMAAATREAARASGGRAVPTENLHVTLAFLGPVPECRLRELGDVAREAAEGVGPALELSFDHLEHWPAAHIICASPAEPPVPVAALACKLQDLLVSRGFSPDLKPFRPHVTVVRKVVRSGGMGQLVQAHPVVWRFTELALIESRTLPQGALYSVVESFPLCGGTNAANNSETS